MQTESMKSVADIFRYNLERLMEENGYTQTSLSEEMGVSMSTINMYVNQKRFPGPENIQRYAEFFRVSPSEFFKTPEEVLRDQQGAWSSHSKKTIVFAGDVTAFAEEVMKYAVDAKTKGFHVHVLTDSLLPCASKEDILECELARNFHNGQMVLLVLNGALEMGKAYLNTDGYIIIPERNPSSPIIMPRQDAVQSILAVVLARKHVF